MQTELRVSRRAAESLRAGHLWVYRSELGAQGDATAPDLPQGALVTVTDSSGRPLGTALYSTSSQIALRLISRTPHLTREQYLDELASLVARAMDRRRVVAPMSAEPGQETNAQRLLFSEADGVPGIIADRYADLVIVQLLTQATAQDDVRQALASILQREFAALGEPLTVWERPDPRIRELEALPAPPEDPLFTNAEASRSTEFLLNGLRFGYDAGSGQKTGAFLDQRLNYAAAAKWVRRSGLTGHALDVCTYQGGFALHLARVCQQVTGVDQSRKALETAELNLSRNPGLRAEVDWIEADAFEFLRALDEESRAAQEQGTQPIGSKRAHAGLPSGLPARFDTIVLDPPAFAKSKRAAEGALRGYKELNLRAMRLLKAGGTLVTCSCSHHIALEDFMGALSEAASDAARRVQVLETRASAPDHPEVLTLPETRYLKCVILRVE